MARKTSSKQQRKKSPVNTTAQRRQNRLKDKIEEKWDGKPLSIFPFAQSHLIFASQGFRVWRAQKWQNVVFLTCPEVMAEMVHQH